MATNKFFSISRFYNMFKNDMLLNHKRYLYILVGAMIVVFTFLMVGMTNTHVNFNIYRYYDIMIFSLLGGGVFVGSSFPELGDKKSTCNYLLLPSSTFEKYLVQFVIRFVLFVPLALFLFWGTAQLARITALGVNSLNGKEIIIDSFNYSVVCKQAFDRFPQIIAFIGIFSLGTYAFSARLFFKRFAIVKTIILAFTLFLLLLGGLVILSHIFIPETHGFEVKLDDIVLGDGLSTMGLFTYYIIGLSWIFFIPMGYFLLKEKQE